MTWRGSNTNQDRLFACLTYLVPLIEVVLLGSFIFDLVPPLRLLFLPLFPLLPFYFLSIGGIGVVEWGIFLALFLGVVRNYQYRHFLRFNTMQAILLGIFAALCRAALELFGISQEVILSPLETSSGFSIGLLFALVSSVIFLFVVGASFFAIVQCIRGLYAEIPIISEAAYSQTR